MRLLSDATRVAASIVLGALVCAPAQSTPIQANSVTGALIEAGGGPGTFSSVRAFASMIGESALESELAKLRTQHGASNTDTFVAAFDYAMDDAWMEAGRSNIHVPTPSQPSGRDLARALIGAGTVDHIFGMHHMLGVLLTPKLRNDVVNDIKLKYGADQGDLFIKMGNQFFYDIAQLVGDESIALSPNH
jgi:hypothetical protein